MNTYLCECGAIVAEERGFANGDYGSQFYGLDGAQITECPGCGKNLQVAYGPSGAQRQREESLPLALTWTTGSDDGLFR